MGSRLSGLVGLFENLHWVPDTAARDALLDNLTHVRGPTVVSFLNAHGVNLAWKLESFREDLAASDLCLRDGIGVKIGMRWLGRDPGLNMNGTDFIPLLVDAFRGRRVALMGTRNPALGESAQIFATRSGVEIVAALDGFRDTKAYIECAQRFEPELILLAMGMPKQEAVARELAAQLKHPCVIVNGGAILDFVSGQVQRAPEWVRRMGAEWVWRLGTEPARLWRRYLVGNVSFLWRVGLASANQRFAAIRQRS